MDLKRFGRLDMEPSTHWKSKIFLTENKLLSEFHSHLDCTTFELGCEFRNFHFRWICRHFVLNRIVALHHAPLKSCLKQIKAEQLQQSNRTSECLTWTRSSSLWTYLEVKKTLLHNRISAIASTYLWALFTGVEHRSTHLCTLSMLDVSSSQHLAAQLCIWACNTKHENVLRRFLTFSTLPASSAAESGPGCRPEWSSLVPRAGVVH